MKIEEIMSETRRGQLRASIDKRRAVIRTQIQSLAQGYTTAMFLWGPGGLGKTHIVTEELDKLQGKSWKHHTSYSTSKGLMLTILEKPDVVHVFEDCEKLYKTDVAASILRAACGSPRGRQRVVTYETAHETISCVFRGAVCIVSNEDLSRTRGPLAAVASRFRPIKWDLTQEERIACILDIADTGWVRGSNVLPAPECRRVAKFLIEEMVAGKTTVPVDLRTFTEHALPAYAQWLQENTTTNWQDIVRAKLAGEVTKPETRNAKTNRLELVALDIAATPDLNTAQRVQLWKDRTGLGQAIYYRHLRFAKAKCPRVNTEGAAPDSDLPTA